MSITKKRRIEFIDIAKGIAIFLVIWGHTATNEELVSPDCGMLTKILYSFHMPLFFFLSGLSMSSKPIKKWSEWKNFLKKNILTVAFPYFIWALIYCAFNFTNVAWIFYGSWQTLGNAATLTSLWYLTSLFVARIIVELIISYTNRKFWIPITVVLLVAGVLLPKLSIGYPWCIDNALVASTCILLGIILKKPLIELSVQRIWLLAAIIAVSAAIFAASVLIDGDNFTNMMMCKSQYGTGIGPLIRAITGSFAVIALSMLLREIAEIVLSDNAKRPLIYIGQYTMGIFLLHKPFMQQVIIPVFTSLMGNIFSTGLIRFFSALVAMILCLPVCNLILRYVPELIGVFSKDVLEIKNK